MIAIFPLFAILFCTHIVTSLAPTGDVGASETRFHIFWTNVNFYPQIPHICQFWYTNELFRPTKRTPKMSKCQIAIIGQNSFAFSDSKSTLPPIKAVVTNLSCDPLQPIKNTLLTLDNCQPWCPAWKGQGNLPNCRLCLWSEHRGVWNQNQSFFFLQISGFWKWKLTLHFSLGQPLQL